jgi:hypothetical protein
MTRHIAVYVGTMALVFAGGGIPAFGEPTPPIRTETDLPREEAAVPDQHAETAVQQEKWEEVHDSQLLNATVYGTNGQEIGKIQQVLKDTQSGETEYVVLVSKESQL